MKLPLAVPGRTTTGHTGVATSKAKLEAVFVAVLCFTVTFIAGATAAEAQAAPLKLSDEDRDGVPDT